jgi:hypothetical protein
MESSTTTNSKGHFGKSALDMKPLAHLYGNKKVIILGK